MDSCQLLQSFKWCLIVRLLFVNTSTILSLGFLRLLRSLTNSINSSESARWRCVLELLQFTSNVRRCRISDGLRCTEHWPGPIDAAAGGGGCSDCGQWCALGTGLALLTQLQAVVDAVWSMVCTGHWPGPIDAAAGGCGCSDCGQWCMTTINSVVNQLCCSFAFKKTYFFIVFNIVWRYRSLPVDLFSSNVCRINSSKTESPLRLPLVTLLLEVLGSCSSLTSHQRCWISDGWSPQLAAADCKLHFQILFILIYIYI